jgi:hypothetical protein
MKKQMIVALTLLLLIPVVLMSGGFLSSLINPEIAAGHPNYARNYHLLNSVKVMMIFGSIAMTGVLWLVSCFLVIRSKERSAWWLFLAVLGPFGFAILAMLDDRENPRTDRHAQFVRGLNWVVRVGYEICTFAIIWLLAYQGMVVMRKLIVLYQAAKTGMSVAQIIDIQNASSGMWAFSEGLEVMFIVVLCICFGRLYST